MNCSINKSNLKVEKMKKSHYNKIYKIFVLFLILSVTSIAFYRGSYSYGSTEPDLFSGVLWGLCALVIVILMSVFEGMQHSYYDFINEWEEELAVTRDMENELNGIIAESDDYNQNEKTLLINNN